MAENNTGAATQGNGAAGHELIINAQYIKDLSFENPRAPHSLMQQKEPPEVQLNVDVKGGNLAPDVFEVVLTIAATAKSAGETAFVIELIYAAIVTLRNATPELLPVLVLVETPRLIFPFARAIVSQVTRDGGFPPLLLHPIDFAALVHRQQQEPAGIATA